MTTDLMPSTTNKLVAGLQARLTEASTLLARGVSEHDQTEAKPGSPLWDSRVFLGRDGKTGARDVNADGTGGGNVCVDDTCWADSPTCSERSVAPVMLAVDPGVQVEQEAP